PIGNGLAGGLACDAVITPVVTAGIDFSALTAMTEEWLAHHFPERAACPTCGTDQPNVTGNDFGPDHPPDHTTGHDGSHTADHTATHALGHNAGHTTSHTASQDGSHNGSHAGDDAGDEAGGEDLRAESHRRLERVMLEWAVQVLSGPGGLASYLRTRVLDRPLNTPSIILDAG
ncbi:hypothetical protein, partial [Actinomadura sp. HBU206391]|uniref:hypothetical protein n=1 Tax=Actinomadura sp. HBU206391 TaxID=2731692 RepID=UPI001C9C876F